MSVNFWRLQIERLSLLGDNGGLKHQRCKSRWKRGTIFQYVAFRGRNHKAEHENQSVDRPGSPPSLWYFIDFRGSQAEICCPSIQSTGILPENAISLRELCLPAFPGQLVFKCYQINTDQRNLLSAQED